MYVLGAPRVAYLVGVENWALQEKKSPDQFLAFWGSSRFGGSIHFFLVFLARNMSEPRFLSYLVRNSSNKQH